MVNLKYLTSLKHKSKIHHSNAAGSGIIVAPIATKLVKQFVAKDLITDEYISIPDFPVYALTKLLKLRITDDKLYAKFQVWCSGSRLFSLSIDALKKGQAVWQEVVNANEEADAFPMYTGLGQEVSPFEMSGEIAATQWQEISDGLPLAVKHGGVSFAVNNSIVYASIRESSQAGIYALDDDTLHWKKIAHHKPGYHPSGFKSAAGRLYTTGNLYITEFDPQTGRYFDITSQLTPKGLHGLRIYPSEFGLIAKASNKKDRKGKEWVAIYNAEQGRWYSAGVLDQGQIIRVKTDHSGHLWITTKNHPKGGVFRAIRNSEGDYQPFELMSSHSGEIAIANDGEIYFIREKAKFTQIQMVLRFVTTKHGFEWVPVHQDSGYAAPGYPVDEQGLFIFSGRFREYVIKGQKNGIYLIPMPTTVLSIVQQSLVM